MCADPEVERTIAQERKREGAATTMQKYRRADCARRVAAKLRTERIIQKQVLGVHFWPLLLELPLLPHRFYPSRVELDSCLRIAAAGLV